MKKLHSYHVGFFNQEQLSSGMIKKGEKAKARFCGEIKLSPNCASYELMAKKVFKQFVKDNNLKHLVPKLRVTQIEW